ncbi:hypothetical protein V1525DRAFT_420420 [Lipomyces kononenkoae]|uniref:Uncharacterized protein n=1 Tax=Lipomyces kononenkoae TaxID=34357 RepID=A0ACC3SXP6_LIPKO
MRTLSLSPTGVSEEDQKLKADVGLWLRKFGSSIGILLCSRRNQGFDFLQPIGRPRLISRRSRPFGPPSFAGHTWFGTLDIALMEVFKMDVHTNDIGSEQYIVVDDGAATVQADSLDIGLALSVDEKDIANFAGD